MPVAITPTATSPAVRDLCQVTILATLICRVVWPSSPLIWRSSWRMSALLGCSSLMVLPVQSISFVGWRTRAFLKKTITTRRAECQSLFPEKSSSGFSWIWGGVVEGDVGGNEVDEGHEGAGQFVITSGEAPEFFEAAKESLHLLTHAGIFFIIRKEPLAPRSRRDDGLDALTLQEAANVVAVISLSMTVASSQRDWGTPSQTNWHCLPGLAAALSTPLGSERSNWPAT